MCRLLTPQLEEALQGYPLYSQDGKGKDAVCCAIFALCSVRWFILEGETEGEDAILFGIVVGLAEDEYGYISLNELSSKFRPYIARFEQTASTATTELSADPTKELERPKAARFLGRI